MKHLKVIFLMVCLLVPLNHIISNAKILLVKFQINICCQLGNFEKGSVISNTNTVFQELLAEIIFCDLKVILCQFPVLYVLYIYID